MCTAYRWDSAGTDGQAGNERDDKLWEELLSSPAFSEWNGARPPNRRMTFLEEGTNGTPETAVEEERKGTKRKQRERKSKDRTPRKRKASNQADRNTEDVADGDNVDSNPLLKPLRAGWRREVPLPLVHPRPCTYDSSTLFFWLKVVTRQMGATAHRRRDIYYFTPEGKKLRSGVEV